jgi:hypothetical protein
LSQEAGRFDAQRAADTDDRQPSLSPCCFLVLLQAGAFFCAKIRVYHEKSARSARKSDKIALFSRKWQYYRTTERLVSVKALIKDGFPRKPLLASPPSFKAGAFLLPRSLRNRIGDMDPGRGENAG